MRFVPFGFLRDININSPENHSFSTAFWCRLVSRVGAGRRDCYWSSSTIVAAVCRTHVPRLALEAIELASYSELELKSMLFPGLTPSFKSSSDTTPSNALTICHNIKHPSAPDLYLIILIIHSLIHLAHLGSFLCRMANASRRRRHHACHLHRIVVAI